MSTTSQASLIPIQPANDLTTLKCQDRRKQTESLMFYNISTKIRVEIGSIYSHGFKARCPCTVDYEGHCHTSQSLSLSSNVSFYCSFHVLDVFLLENGAMFHYLERLV
jgi:hypothetical protein